MPAWCIFPAEIQAMILDFLVADAFKMRKRKGHLFAKCASVCRDWQAVMERANFKSLTLFPDDLHEFEHLFLDNLARRQALKRVWFRVTLPAYSKEMSLFMENEGDREVNDGAFAEQVWALFHVLSSWDPTHTSLELEITAASSSDKRSYFRNAEARTARFEESDLDMDMINVQLMGWHGLPEVEVISSLCFLRRNYRTLSPRSLLFIASSLPRLNQLRLELWEQFSHGDQNEYELDIAQLLKFWPPTLRKVNLFNNARGNEYLFEIDEPQQSRHALPLLSQNLARLSQGMDEFSSCFMGDAQFFFAPFYQGQVPRGPKLPQWESLSSLTLTTDLISPNKTPDETNDLLQAAGNAAKRMPKLRTMELFSAGKVHAGVFLYLVTATAATASWESTWKFKINNKVKQTWSTAASVHSRYELEFGREVLLKDYAGSSKFIYLTLATFDVVLHPLTSNKLLKGQKLPSA